MRVVVVGAGGHARSVIDALRTGTGQLEPAGCTDPDPTRAGSSLDGVPILGDDALLSELLGEGIEGACLGVGGVGSNELRRRLFERLRSLGFALPAVVHGDARVAASARLGPASQVLAGAIVGAGAQIGENVIVNSGAIVEHDCRVDDHAHLATGCALGGAVHVEASAHVGLGACVMQGVVVGEEAVVGAGAVVIRDVPGGLVVAGCPAVALERNG